ncbi:hypothetical protein [Aureliella helgolandensis]|uniref:Uncharacterized protein n=1 Tax=Aureliella helgolandensis TaxID=2527968 RepID=A0A518GAZ8_9BACT|nr:hypothetical protein [Aureliella helgolandensis]QDV25778.1 hypothetical protein Q31a_41050 [Aureliella helgolandensis]
MHNGIIDQFFDEIPTRQWDRWLKECRVTFGESPRYFDAATEQMLLVNPPWVTKLRWGDALAKLVQNRTLRRLFSKGKIVWGHVIQANDELYLPAPSVDSYTYDRAGELVFSLDDSVEPPPSQLERVAVALAGLRYASELDSELQPWADYLDAETTRVVGKQVPDRIAPCGTFFVSTTLFRRSHLPNGVLCQSLLPIVVEAQQPHFTMPLPHAYWPTSLLEWWSCDR